ncbi:MAG: protein-L-isoaspartate O-methyltransferase [Hyphomicrobiales bacterium]|nr:protein-L-isoaspartate O-methyltransferase [Hyphomicrobiales bacterium]
MNVQILAQPLSNPAALARRTMVDGQVRTYDVTNLDLIDRLLSVPREAFLPAELAARAYSDAALALPGSPPRRLLAPMVLARLLQAAAINPQDRVLDLAGGLGYGAALVAGLAREVVMVEADAARVSAANAAFAQIGLGNARAVSGDIAKGAAAEAPFTLVIVNGAFELLPAALLAQIAPGGRLVGVRSQNEVVGEAVRLDVAAGTVGERPLFSCHADIIEGFARPASFSF